MRAAPLIALGLLLLTATARAESVAERFASGKLEFEHKNFGNALQLLRPLLEPVVQLAKEEDIVLARELLGLVYFYTGNEEGARDQFRRLLYLRPRHRLDPFLIPPQAVRFFDQIWSDPQMKEQLEKIEKEQEERDRLDAEKNKPQVKTLVRREYLKQVDTEHYRLVAFLPFGLGQFQNGHTLKGVLLATGGGLALATNVVCYGLQLALANDQGQYSKAEIPTIRALRVTQYVSLGVLAGLWAYGAIDANLYFTPVTQGPVVPVRQETEELTSPVVGPAAFEGGAGLVVTGRF